MKETTYSAPGRTGGFSVQQMDRWCQARLGMDHMELTRWLHPHLQPPGTPECDLLRRQVGKMILMLMDSEARLTP